VTKNDERRLSIFEKKILRRIHGPICDKGHWQKRYNRELEDLYSEPYLVNVIKYSRLGWAGHVAQRDKNELPKKKILHTNPGGQQGRGQPKSRWTDWVEEETRKLGCRNWMMTAQDRSHWQQMPEETKTNLGL
jgi:hypothetical protein